MSEQIVSLPKRIDGIDRHIENDQAVNKNKSGIKRKETDKKEHKRKKIKMSWL